MMSLKDNKLQLSLAILQFKHIAPKIRIQMKLGQVQLRIITMR